MRLLTFVLITVCCLGGCRQPRLHDDADLDASIRRISQLLDEYNRIPVKTRDLGDRSFIVVKDRAQIQSFYERYRDEIRIMNNVFLLSAKGGSIWSDDADFSRGVLYCLLTQLIPNSLTHEGAIAAWRDFLRLGSKVHIEEFTRVAMGNAFVNYPTLITTPNLSYEDNIRVIFRAHMVLSLVAIKEYRKAIREIEVSVEEYPTSTYARNIAPEQIRSIKDLMEKTTS